MSAAAGTIEARPAARRVAAARCVVVVVHYQGAADTRECVRTIRAHSSDTPVVLVDNASSDGSGAELAREFAASDDVLWLRAEHNGGFGAGCNLGIERALALGAALGHVLLLNPDARLRAGAVAALLACAARHADAGVVGCRIVAADGAVWFANGRFPRTTLSGFHCAPPAGCTEFAAGFVTGCCMLIDAELLRAGLRFDESFFLYCEDADLCQRVRAGGRSLWITSAATVEHRGGGSQPGRPVLGELSAERLFWLTRAKVLLARKHLRWPQRIACYAVLALGKPLAALLGGHGGRWLGPYFRGLRAGLATRPQPRTTSQISAPR